MVMATRSDASGAVVKLSHQTPKRVGLRANNSRAPIRLARSARLPPLRVAGEALPEPLRPPANAVDGSLEATVNISFLEQ